MLNQEARNEIEQQIKELQKHVGDSDALKTLEATPEFVRLFLDGLFRDEAIQILFDKSSPESIAEPSLRKLLDEKLDMVHVLYAHFGTIHFRGNEAKENITKLSEALAGK